MTNQTGVDRDDGGPLAQGWLHEFEERFEHDPDYIAQGLAIEITEQAVELMEKRGINRARLAALMDVSRAYVTRLLNAPPNMTLRSVAQLAVALGTKPHVSLYHDDPTTATQPTYVLSAGQGGLIFNRLPIADLPGFVMSYDLRPGQATTWARSYGALPVAQGESVSVGDKITHPRTIHHNEPSASEKTRLLQERAA